MPNWCYNRMTVYSPTGDYKDVVEVIKKITDDEGKFSFNTLVPMPKELLDYPSPNRDEEIKERFLKEYGAEDWYSWRLKNWGCKWDCESDDIPSVEDMLESGEDWFEFTFDSPWSPPVEWFEKLCETFPDMEMRIKYEEEGMCFMGVMVNIHGHINNQCISY